MTADKKPLILFKYGGNAMTSDWLKERVVAAICSLRGKGYRIVIAHGGGPFIQEALDKAGIESEFIKGHRRTTPQALQYVEMALKGQVNSELVRLINAKGVNAVGLSGKDGRIVTAKKRIHKENGEEIDLDRVGEVAKVNVHLLILLLQNEYLPVITCLASDEEGKDYNVNADLFAGSLAGALGVDIFAVLTDVDGLMKDINDPESMIRDLHINDLRSLEANGIIKGGMLPKVEACRTAVENGAKRAVIINGTQPQQIAALLKGKAIGTTIKK